MNDLKTLLAQLVAFQSITPSDAGCNAFMIDQLKSIGFHCQTVDSPPVSNFFARIGNASPLLVFAGHTDVVSVGESHQWHTDPFTLHRNGDFVFARGVADMKGSLACMLRMAYRFCRDFPTFKGSLGFLITSAEEGAWFELGTPLIMQYLADNNIAIDYCVVGEPSSTNQVGDVLKIGRRGSLTAKISLNRAQGYETFPYYAENPMHRLAPALAELTSLDWDSGNQWFPPTTMQITHLCCESHEENSIPDKLNMQFNFRFSTEQTPQSLQKKVEQCFEAHQLQPNIHWRLNGLPFLTEHGRLLQSTIRAVQAVAGLDPKLSTDGGTSDGRFIAPHGVEVIELGPVNASIHQVNEWVSLFELEQLEEMYYKIAQSLLT